MSLSLERLLKYIFTLWAIVSLGACGPLAAAVVLATSSSGSSGASGAGVATAGSLTCSPDAYRVRANEVLTLPEPGVLSNDSAAVTRVAAADSVSDLGAKVHVSSGGALSYDPSGLAAVVALRAGATLGDRFSYRGGDGIAQSEACTVSITVEGVNDAPLATEDLLQGVSQDGQGRGGAPGVLANDRDPDGDSLSVVAVNGEDARVGSRFLLPSGASLTLHADGSYLYQTNGAFQSLASGEVRGDSFSYTCADPSGARSTPVLVRIPVEGLNDPPRASPDRFDTVVGNTRYEVGRSPTLAARHLGSLLDNDTDPEAQTLTAIAETKATRAGGSVEIRATGEFVFTPKTGFAGTDEFSYSVRDPEGALSSSKAELVVTGPVWYVDVGAPSGGDGTDLAPFQTLAQADAVAPKDGSVLYVKGDAQGDLSLGRGQRVVGTGAALVVSGHTLRAAAGKNRLNATITLGQDNSLTGFHLNRTTPGAGLVGVDFGALTVVDLEIQTSTGPALQLTRGSLSTGSTFRSVVCSDSPSGGVLLEDISGSVPLGAVNLTTSGGSALRVVRVGSAAVLGGTLNASNGPALTWDSSPGTVALTSLGSSSSAGRGVDISAWRSPGSLSIGRTLIKKALEGGVRIRNSPGIVFSCGDLDVTDSGTTGNNAGHAVELREGNAGAVFRTQALDLASLGGGGLVAKDCTVELGGPNGTIAATGGAALDLENVAGKTAGLPGLKWQTLTSHDSDISGARLVGLRDDVEVTGVTTITNPRAFGVSVRSLPTGVDVRFGPTTIVGGQVGLYVGSETTVNAGSVTFASVKTENSGAEGLQIHQTKLCVVTGTLEVLNAQRNAGVRILQNTANGGGRTEIGTLVVANGGNTPGLVSTRGGGVLAIHSGSIAVRAGRAVDLRTADLEVDVTLTRIDCEFAPDSAIVLEDVRGSFELTGNGSTALGGDGSGGTLANGSNHPIVELTRVRNVTLRNLRFDEALKGSIKATNVFNCWLEYSTVYFTTRNDPAVDYQVNSGTSSLGLRGVYFERNAVSGPAGGTVRFKNSGTGVATLQVLSCHFQYEFWYSIHVTAESMGKTTTRIGGPSAGEGNRFSDALGAEGGGLLLGSTKGEHEILVQGNTFHRAKKGSNDDAIMLSNYNTAIVSAEVLGNQILEPAGTINGGLAARLDGGRLARLVVANNVMDDLDAPAVSVYVGPSAAGPTDLRITGNKIGQTTPSASTRGTIVVTGSSGSASYVPPTGTLNLLIQSNQIRRSAASTFSAISVAGAHPAGGPRVWNVSVLDNLVEDITNDATNLIRVSASGVLFDMCTNIRGNQLSGAVPELQLSELSAADVRFEGPTTTVITAGELSAINNTATSTVSGTPTYSGGTACPLPAP